MANRDEWCIANLVWVRLEALAGGTGRGQIQLPVPPTPLVHLLRFYPFCPVEC